MRIKTASLLTTIALTHSLILPAHGAALNPAANAVKAVNAVHAVREPDVLELAKIGIFADAGCTQEVDLMSLQGEICYPLHKDVGSGDGKQGEGGKKGLFMKVVWTDKERVDWNGVRISKKLDCSDGWTFVPISPEPECLFLADKGGIHVVTKDAPHTASLFPRLNTTGMAADPPWETIFSVVTASDANCKKVTGVSVYGSGGCHYIRRTYFHDFPDNFVYVWWDDRFVKKGGMHISWSDECSPTRPEYTIPYPVCYPITYWHEKAFRVEVA